MAISDHSNYLESLWTFQNFGKPVIFHPQALFHHSGWRRALLLVILSLPRLSRHWGKAVTTFPGTLGFCHAPSYSQAGRMRFSWINEVMERKLCLQFFHQDWKSCLFSFLPSAIKQPRTEKETISAGSDLQLSPNDHPVQLPGSSKLAKT